MKRYISKKVTCPYYKHESRQVIDCVGVNEGTVIHLAFSNAKEWCDHKRNICGSEYEKCLIYQMLKGTHKLE